MCSFSSIKKRTAPPIIITEHLGKKPRPVSAILSYCFNLSNDFGVILIVASVIYLSHHKIIPTWQ